MFSRILTMCDVIRIRFDSFLFTVAEVIGTMPAGVRVNGESDPTFALWGSDSEPV